MAEAIAKPEPFEADEHYQENQMITNQLQLKSSAHESQTLSKKAVLKRIRNHRCLHRIKTFLFASSNGSAQPDLHHLWVDHGDVFSCP